jgi:uroporphyrin-3 C-methyltransferase
MTEKNSDLVPATVENRTSDEAYAGYGSDTRSGRKSLAGPTLLVAGVLVVALAAALWYEHRTYQNDARLLTEQVQAAKATASQALDQARQAGGQVQQQAQTLAGLQQALADSQDQVDTLVQAFQALTDTGSDIVLVNDIDHLVTIAQQQLQLGGNVANAIVALETAQAQLARANRPSLASLQQTINGDLDRLRAVSTVDVAMLTDQLDTLASLVSQAPLLVPDDAAPASSSSAPPFTGFTVPPVKVAQPDQPVPWWKTTLATAGNWFSSAWDALRHDMGEFISVRRVDDAAALLMSPDQATRFRENLRLRIMTAQLALMMKQPKVWRGELDALVDSLQSRFDEKAADTRQALKIARQLQDTVIDTRLPSVSNSLKAIEAVRDEQARKAPSAAVTPSDTPAQDSSDQPADAPSPADAPATGKPSTPVAPSSGASATGAGISSPSSQG